MNGTIALKGFIELLLGRFMFGECGGISKDSQSLLFLKESIM